MIIGNNKDKVIQNIRNAANAGELNRKVEVDDPNLTNEERKAVLGRYLKRLGTPQYQVNHLVATRIVDKVAKRENANTIIVGFENIEKLEGSAIVTSNHFNPIDYTVTRMMAIKKKMPLAIVGQETNLAMDGFVGFIMNYVGMIPISSSKGYMINLFEPLLKKTLNKKSYVLIYPEQEMWFNYRKPRSFKRGAYYYAAKFNVPVISCLVEIRDLPELESSMFHKTQYVLHILDLIYPDPDKSVRDNSFWMCEKDYEQKKEAYEKAYKKPLNYEYEAGDIAGLVEV